MLHVRFCAPCIPCRNRQRFELPRVVVTQRGSPLTHRANAKIAGISFLAYIALGMFAMVLHGNAQEGENISVQLANIAQHMAQLKLAAVLDLLCGFAAITLGVTLFALTREVDSHLAMLGLACRVAEGIVAGVSVQRSQGLIWLAGAVQSDASNTEATNTIAGWLLGTEWSYLVAATFFAVGSTAFSWLFLRGRLIPIALAWLGVIASALLVLGLLLQLGGFVPGSALWAVWIPMAVFEVVLAAILIVKGVAVPRNTVAA